MADRRLVSIRRRVAESDASRYEGVWRRLAATVTGQGAHAWRFRSERDEELFIEFLEFRAELDPRDEPAVISALEELAEIGMGDSEGWIDAEDLTKETK